MRNCISFSLIATGVVTSWDDLYQRADAALLHANRSGRDRVVMAS
jgi:PleD family two-component response regulator